jgi:hypothetical protein
MDNETEKLCRTAYNAYLITLEQANLEPSFNYLPYDFDHIKSLKWKILGEEMVFCELRELTNIVNQWRSYLRKWHAWNLVIGKYKEEDAWELRIEFLETRAHYCLLQPSAVRDKITFVATNALHQVRLASENDYKDYLDGDPTAQDKNPRHPTRRIKENRLYQLISKWSESNGFMEALRKIDNETYRQQTFDYRNKNSHAIGPRLGVGITQMKEQDDGTWIDQPIPNKLSVSYGFGGTLPLDMEEARIANLEQYELAHSCYANYRKLLAQGLDSIPSRE